MQRKIKVKLAGGRFLLCYEKRRQTNKKGKSNGTAKEIRGILRFTGGSARGDYFGRM